MCPKSRETKAVLATSKRESNVLRQRFSTCAGSNNPFTGVA